MGDAPEDRYDSRNKIDIQVAERLREIRRARGIATDDLVKYLGISADQIAKYETCYNRLSVGTLYVLSEYLGVPVTMFFPDFGKVGTADKSSLRLAQLLSLFEAIPCLELQQAVLTTSRSLKSGIGVEAAAGKVGLSETMSFEWPMATEIVSQSLVTADKLPGRQQEGRQRRRTASRRADRSGET